MKIKILIAALLVPCAVLAADLRVLSLDDAINAAMDKNKTVEQAKEYINYLKGVYVENRAAALPSASAYSTIGRSKDPSTGAAINSYTFNSYSAGVKVSQALFTWGQVGAAIRAAQIGLKTGDEQLRMYRQAVRKDVISSYTDILLCRRLLEISKENEAQKQRHYDEAQKKYRLGTATDYDVLAAKVALENTRPDIITNENNLRLAKDNLRFLLSADYDIDVQGELKPDIKDVADYDTLIRLALDRRPEILDKKLSIAVDRELVTVKKAGDKPRLDLSGSFDRTKLEGTEDYTGNTWSVGLTLSYPFFDGMQTRGRVAQAQSDMRKAKIQELQTEDSVSLDVRQALNGLKQARQTILAAQSTVTEAKKLLDMAEKGYVYGVKTKLDVDDAQYNLNSGEVAEARADRDYQVQYANLLLAVGVLGEDEGAVLK